MLVLDRIKKSFENGAKEKGPLAHALLNFAIKYKIGWYRKGYSTPILDRLFFKKFRDALGGRLVFLATGGATVSQEVQDYVTACLNCEFVIGYGLTECTALCTITPTDDRVTGHVGFPGEGGYIRLADWKEGGYSTKDKPYPRGEVVIGGKSVTVGYFNNPELTKKVYEEKDGIWWFYTGDIGELLPGNRLRLIDRRKDLVKLSTGEYVALGQVESRLKSCPEVDNVCVSAAAQNRLLALVVPNYEVLKQRFGSGRSLGDMCRDPAVVRYISSMLREHGLMSGLNSREIPADYRLVADEWTPDSGLVTAALKLKRHSIETFYQNHINDMMHVCTSP
ncbi:ACSL4 [Cordylochernes scorpioides]|uniref:long-chain-fatty-acid--CoA ligase n=1 Tax=Cordylochernes scorpioides TaxID=51811 RepID=A0ABY6KQQ1_9ARAC|nr:ACSL4 [Cordylochernes scorpioides]